MVPAPFALVAGFSVHSRQPFKRDLTFAGGVAANTAVVRRSRSSIRDMLCVLSQQIGMLYRCTQRGLRNLPCDNVERIRADLTAAASLVAQSGVIAGHAGGQVAQHASVRVRSSF